MSETKKYFLDTEFIEDGHTIDLISIAIVCEDNREIHLQNHKCEFKRASDWVWRNVFPHLQHFSMTGTRACRGRPGATALATGDQSRCQDDNCLWRDRYEIRDEVKRFLSPDEFGKPEIWGYYADYDWVAFCQLFGAMIDLPKGYPMYCRDLKQLCVSVGDPQLPKCEGEHNVLVDARWNRDIYRFLTNLPKAA